MKKVVNIFALLVLSSLNFVSAYGVGGGSFRNFSITNLLRNFDTSLIVLALTFLIIFYALYKTTEKANLITNHAARVAITLIISIFAIYGIVKSNFQVENLLYKVGLSQEFLAQIIPWILVALIIIGIIKFGLANLFFITGGIFIAAAIFGLVYEKGISVVIGISLIIIGLIILGWKRKRAKKAGIDWVQEAAKRKLKKKEKKDINKPQQNNQQPSNPPRTDILKTEARNLKNWTKTQSNPKFYQTWAYFLSWLKRKGYGSSEKDIMQKLNVTQKDIQRAVRKYVR